MACYTCGVHGHLAKECPGGSHTYDNSACYNCGEWGHISRDCQKEKRCYNCGETGHLSTYAEHPSSPPSSVLTFVSRATSLPVSHLVDPFTTTTTQGVHEGEPG